MLHAQCLIYSLKYFLSLTYLCIQSKNSEVLMNNNNNNINVLWSTYCISQIKEVTWHSKIKWDYNNDSTKQ